MKDKKILFGTFISLLVLLTTGLSYAYFSTSVSGNNDAKDVVVETGTLKLVYTDSPEIVAEHIKPGWSTTNKVTKMFAMFYKAENLSKIYASDKFVTDNVISSTNMFLRCLNLSGYNSSYVDKTFARISGNGVTGYFTAK